MTHSPQTDTLYGVVVQLTVIFSLFTGLVEFGPQLSGRFIDHMRQIHTGVTGNFPPLKIFPPGGEDFLGNFPPTLKIYPPGGKFS